MAKTPKLKIRNTVSGLEYSVSEREWDLIRSNPEVAKSYVVVDQPSTKPDSGLEPTEEA